MNLVLPTNAQPTDVLANRFATWRKVIRAINVYLREVASVQDEVVRQNVRLSHAMSIPFLDYGTAETADDNAIAAGVGPRRPAQPAAPQTSGDYVERDEGMFLPYGNHSLGDVPGSVIRFHRQQASAASKLSKELTQQVIPRLEDLRRDLLVKLKEIKNLASDFKSSVGKEQAQSAKEIQNYTNAVQLINSSSSSLLNPKHDPYLLKVSLDRQLVRQVNEENYLLEAFLNLQGSGRELEYVVAQEVQQALATFGKLFGQQADNVLKLLVDPLVNNGFVKQEPTFEWDAFVKRDPNFVDPELKPRKLTDIHYDYQDSPLAHQIRAGYLERRSKYLKSYSKAWYVLTPAFLHEFKSSDRRHDPHPVMSLSLDDCQLSSDSKSSSSSYKFILNAKQSHKGHNWVFRAEDEHALDDWFSDLKKLTALSSPQERANLFVPAAVPTSALESSRSSALPASAAASSRDVILPIVAPIGVDSQPTDLSSPVSNNSEVTSNGEPFEHEESAANIVEEDIDQPSKPRGRFGSEVNLDGAGLAAGAGAAAAVGVAGVAGVAGIAAAASHNSAVKDDNDEDDDDAIPVVTNRNRAESAAQFLPANDLRKLASNDNASVFSYDLKKDSGKTLTDDAEFEPVHSDLPVEVERRLTLQTKHKEEDDINGIGVARHPDEAEIPTDEALTRRRSSIVSATRERPVRRATGSLGGDGGELKPLTSDSGAQPGLFFANGLPSTTSSGKE